MTVAGAVMGGVIGKDVAGQYDRSIQRVDYRMGADVRRCENTMRVKTVEKLVGYKVTYRYRGETYTTRTDSHPGERIEVRVNVRPAKAVYKVHHDDHDNGRPESRTRNF